MFKQLESASIDTRVPLAALLDAIPYNEEGLVPAIAQDTANGDVLMLAWMNRTTIERTLQDGYAWYYSRSRKAFWKKGETSGHLQRLVSLRLDCDGDALLLEVEQQGSACHTFRPNCFYLLIEGDEVRVTCDPG